MTIILTGGGSGGHITPLSAVAAELKRQSPSVKVVYIGQKGDRFGARMADEPSIDAVRFISAGKFRRYHSGLRWLLDTKTIALNFRDFFRFLVGIWQSRRIIKELSPCVIFIKGGFVGVPVGLVAAALKVPFITHDSDAIPGLANRMIGRWASINAVALPDGEYKNYSSEKIITTGIPLREVYKKVSISSQSSAKKRLGLDKFEQVILITGGGLGAERLNSLFLSVAPQLLEQYKSLVVIHQAGEKLAATVLADYKSLSGETDLSRIRVLGFCSDLHNYSAAADVIITRAGATTLAEFGIQQKPCIVVPNAELTGGHQLINAETLNKHDAVVVIQEGEGADAALLKAIRRLLDNGSEARRLADNLGHFAVPGAASKLAGLLLNISEAKTRKS